MYINYLPYIVIRYPNPSSLISVSSEQDMTTISVMVVLDKENSK